ncbi:MAG: hypothetical protein AAGF24_04820 [Cyanobacteria bacterium P01_H01_bin.121]
MSLATFGLDVDDLHLATGGLGLQLQEITNDLIVAATLATRVRAYATAELYARTAADLEIAARAYATTPLLKVQCYAALTPRMRQFAKISIRRKDD